MLFVFILKIKGAINKKQTIIGTTRAHILRILLDSEPTKKQSKLNKSVKKTAQYSIKEYIACLLKKLNNLLNTDFINIT